MNVRRQQVRTQQARPARRPHTLLALIAIAAVAAVGLIARQPLPATAPAGLLIAAMLAPAGGGALRTEGGLDDAADQAAADPSPSKPHKHARRGRQSLAIPYFSFARS